MNAAPPVTVLGLTRPPDAEAPTAPDPFWHLVAGELGDHLLTLGAPSVETLAVTLGGTVGGVPGPPRLDAVLWAAVAPDAVERMVTPVHAAGRVGTWAMWTVTAQRRFDRAAPEASPADPSSAVPPSDPSPFAGLAGRTTPGVKRLSLHRRIPGITVDTYRRRFAVHFAITERHMTGARGYRQDDVVEAVGPGSFPVDGMSEFWFPSLVDARTRAYGDEDDAAVVVADAHTFADGTTSVGLFGVAHVRGAGDG